ncbi:MAG: S41 family peptidase [Cytophagales bacterium]|nr:S41 family peptidase [Cytophagales bacterium]
MQRLNRIFRGLVVLIITTGFQAPVIAQWKVVFSQQQLKQDFYSLRADNYQSEPGYYFPPYEYLEEPLTDGYNLLEAVGKEGKTGLPLASGELQEVWEKNFEPMLDFYADSTILYQRVLARYIDAYAIHFFLPDEQRWLTKRYSIKHEGYQVPGDEDISDWSEQELPAYFRVGKMAITVSQAEPRAYEFTVGDLVLRNGYREIVEAQQPFINRLFDRDPLLGYDIKRPSGYSPSLIANSPESFYACKDCRGSYSVIGSEEDKEAPLVVKILDLSLQYYPYYEEKGLDKAEIYNDFQQIVENHQHKPEDEFLPKLEQFVFETFQDPHFRVEVPKQKAKRGIFPLRLYDINNKLFIAASFKEELDPLLNKEVIKVNGIEASYLLDSLTNLQYGAQDRRRRLALTQMTEAFQSDAITITYLEENCNPTEIVVERTRKPRVPPGFRAKSYEFKMLEGDIAYFRILKWQLGVYLRFLNHWEEIQQAKGLIIDLRNNGGGEALGAMRMFSLFIPHAKPYNYSYSYVGNKKETTVIKPNKERSFPVDQRVVILGNELTGCASEEFILAMTRLDNVLFFSGNNTGGSLASVYDFYFPSGLRFRTNSAADKNYFPGDKVIEDQGIEPDVWMKYSSIYDLAPYENTLLNKGVELLGGR